MRPARGFTLIEVLAVTALLGMLAVAVAWSLAEDVRQQSLAMVGEQLVQQDHLMRLTARSFGRPCELRLDLDRQRVRRVRWDAAGREVDAPALDLSRNWRIDRVMVRAASARDLKTAENGEVIIRCGAGGFSPAYALHLTVRTAQTTSAAKTGTSCWLVFAGLTGQMTVMHEDYEVENLFTLATSSGADAP